ncbi:CorA family divalent cation transporter [Streptomyces avermitilis]|uniref:CorA family divalent cation transporter n=1 Tax=Streptomyces avermitilis TaxID=33903 RepID=UPI0038040B62
MRRRLDVTLSASSAAHRLVRPAGAGSRGCRRCLDELPNSALDAHLARLGTWQYDDMRWGSSRAAIGANPTVVAGVYGMNVAHLPGLSWMYGYPLAVAGMVGAGRPRRYQSWTS